MKKREDHRAQHGARLFWADVPARTSRRGSFWAPGERVIEGGNTFQRGPMFAGWEAPETVTRPHPIVLVHGGTFQGTEWLDTSDEAAGCLYKMPANKRIFGCRTRIRT